MRSDLPNVITALVISASGTLAAPALEKDRNALWKIVHDVCIRHWLSSDDPWPCTQIVDSDESENGVAIEGYPGQVAVSCFCDVTDFGHQESSTRRSDLFEAAWEARRFVFDKLGRVLPRDNVGLAINSALRRSQDQVHIPYRLS